MTDKMIVLADLGRVKAYRFASDGAGASPRMELVEDIEFVESHEPIRERVTDMAGRFPGGGGTPWMTQGEHHNLELETERRLIKLAAEKIDSLVDGWRYWCLAAPAEINPRLVGNLSERAKAHLLKNVQLDLVKTPHRKLPAFFRPGPV